MSVPWFIGQEGAQHSAEVARHLVYATTSGAEGVVGVNDMKVHATSTPSGNVRMLSGGCLLRNTSPGGGGQSYVDFEPALETLAIPATTSSGGRSDLICRTVEDPQYPPHTTPSDPAVGPYGFYRRFNVPAGTTDADSLGLSYPVIALARIDLPASTAAVTNDMITDLRQVAIPLRDRDMSMKLVTVTNDLTSNLYTTWPAQSETMRYIPKWAGVLWARIDIIEALHYGGGNTDGELTMTLGGQPSYLHERRFDLVWSGSSARVDQTIISGFNIPDEWRGTVQPLRIRGRRLNGSGFLRADTYTQIAYDLEWNGKLP